MGDIILLVCPLLVVAIICVILLFMQGVVWCCFVLAEGPLLRLVYCRSANAWLMHFGFTCFTLLMGPPSLGWFMSSCWWWLTFYAVSSCNCIVIAFFPFGFKRRFVCLGWFSLVLGGSLFPQDCFVFLCLDIYIHMYCWFPACSASLSCNFLIYPILTFDQKNNNDN
jgi:hypothetical protein